MIENIEQIAVPKFIAHQPAGTGILPARAGTHIVGEKAGAGVFTAPAASVSDVTAHYQVVSLGETNEIRERFFLISAERRLAHPAARAVSEHARSGLFALIQ